jgi:hypothetical protein
MWIMEIVKFWKNNVDDILIFGSWKLWNLEEIIWMIFLNMDYGSVKFSNNNLDNIIEYGLWKCEI